uniref:Uncharacterized protein n=2 Tax=Sipha flava TaxID=143950 RepID=A0A2S2QTJ3_9HEMI
MKVSRRKSKSFKIKKIEYNNIVCITKHSFYCCSCPRKLYKMSKRNQIQNYFTKRQKTDDVPIVQTQVDINLSSDDICNTTTKTFRDDMFRFPNTSMYNYVYIYVYIYFGVRVLDPIIKYKTGFKTTARFPLRRTK